MARELGAPLEALAEGLRTFRGAGRRMELIADTAGVIVYDDYGHHPTEVRATLAAMRQKVGDRRLWAVFEPHMYSRTALFLDEFARAFTDADEVVIVDIFASRDTDASLRATSAEALADAIERTSAVSTMAGGDVDAATAYVAQAPQPRRRRAGDGGGEVVSDRPGPQGRPQGGSSDPVPQPLRPVSGSRSVFLGALLALGVAILQEALVRLVEASGAKDQPAVILILLLAAFLGLLTAVVVRALKLAGAVAPTVLVIGWIVVPPLLRAIPAPVTQIFASDASLTAADAVALAVAVIAAAVTLGVQAEPLRAPRAPR